MKNEIKTSLDDIIDTLLENKEFVESIEVLYTNFGGEVEEIRNVIENVVLLRDEGSHLLAAMLLSASGMQISDYIDLEDSD